MLRIAPKLDPELRQLMQRCEGLVADDTGSNRYAVL